MGLSVVRLRLFALLFCCLSASAFAAWHSVLQVTVGTPAHSITLSCPGTGSTSSTISCSGTYTGTAPSTSGWTYSWNAPLSGSGSVTSIASVSGGTITGIVIPTPSGAGTGTVSVTDNLSDSATSGSVVISAPAAYTGPGDIDSTWQWWGGLRAYSSATRGTVSINVCNVSDVACADMSTDASTGALVVTTVGGSNCAVVTCTVKTLYNKVGGGNDATQATIGTRPTLALTGCTSGSNACMVFTGAQYLTTPSALVINTPQTVYGVALENNSSAHAGVILRNATSEVILRFAGSGVTQALAYSAGCGVNASGVSTDVWHTLQGVLNSASSFVYLDGTGIAGGTSCGGNLNSTVGIGDGPGDTGDGLTGKMAEVGIANTAIGSTPSSTLSSNAKTFWGY